MAGANAAAQQAEARHAAELQAVEATAAAECEAKLAEAREAGRRALEQAVAALPPPTPQQSAPSTCPRQLPPPPGGQSAPPADTAADSPAVTPPPSAGQQVDLGKGASPVPAPNATLTSADNSTSAQSGEELPAAALAANLTGTLKCIFLNAAPWLCIIQVGAVQGAQW